MEQAGLFVQSMMWYDNNEDSEVTDLLERGDGSFWGKILALASHNNLVPNVRRVEVLRSDSSLGTILCKAQGKFKEDGEGDVVRREGERNERVVSDSDS